MPIKPENRLLYPADWKQISLEVRKAANWCCEFCEAKNGEPHPQTGSKVVLTVAHLNHDPSDCRRENLKALCQRCHLTYDAQHHAENAKRTRQQKAQAAREAAGQKELL